MIAHLLSLVVLAFAVSLDGFGVGVTYGLRNIRIPIVSVFIIACCSGLIIWLSMQAGGWLSGFVSEGAAKIIGASILIAIGCWALIQLWRSKHHKDPSEDQVPIAGPARAVDSLRLADTNRTARDEEAAAMQIIKLELKRLGLVIQILRTPQAADVDRSGIISASEAVMLGVALSLDAFGAGLGAALLGLPAMLTAVVIAVSSAVFLVGGTQLGLRFSSRQGMGRALSVLPGILLIMMGILRLL
ncbi:MntP/YtaF family protein [Paenibacillus sp. LHD-117]|uniref:MntP/YtaF family protein n=1 Tax=Paenibacillus sp. LHD-117 TaxID=3071412 RepID=UPI0027E019B0|nr:MntP/YtaF family protein [Paenibacillus sp. LHD-117]MDQ6418388.1 MntP/YtaF family protein [Paenibacillus sp. LHD-117]